MIRILTEPRNALVKQYQKLLEMDHVSLEFETDALEAIAEEALKRNTGARGLRSIVEDIMMDIMYDIPSRTDVEKVIVNKACVLEHSQPIVITRQSA